MGRVKATYWHILAIILTRWMDDDCRADLHSTLKPTDNDEALYRTALKAARRGKTDRGQWVWADCDTMM